LLNFQNLFNNKQN